MGSLIDAFFAFSWAKNLGQRLTAAVLILTPLQAFACDTPLLAAAGDDASIRITFPQEGEVVERSSFELLMVMEGDLEGARVDHVHVQLDDGDNDTAPDLSGVYSFEDIPDGEHTITIYMATPEHIPVNGKQKVHFTISTSGVALLGPSQGEVVQSSDVTVAFGIFGSRPSELSHVAVSLDGASSVAADPDASSVIFEGILDGDHTVEAWLADVNNQPLRESTQRSFSVKTALSQENAQKAFRKVKKAIKKDSPKLLKAARRILSRMKKGGSENPEDSRLNARVVRKILKLLVRSKGDLSSTQLRKAMKMLKGMMR